MRAAANTHAILDPRAGEARFTLARAAPGAALAPFVERYWIVRWDLRGRAPYAQETLPFPCVNLVLGSATKRARGTPNRPGDGLGWVVGAKFRAGGFRPFWRADVSELTGRALAIAEAFGDAGAALDRAIHAAADDAARIAHLEAFLAERAPGRDDAAELAVRAVELAQARPAIARVGELAAALGLPVRALERLFRACVGVPPKWVIRRFRVQEAAARAAAGEVPDWAALAHELGYFDQAHLIRDFKAQVGRTPADYAAQCARSR
jgi:AraC-like DNA-binding protein